ncbi:MAG: DUF4280 domain-containing protein [Flavobacteriaceae bacterium]|nr:DUF4280 domain-containing protein [Flavobacteriaceae bacterium]
MAKNYVCNGAKIECKLCTKPEGTLKVTSNEIKVQDKIFATEGDKEKTNLIFEGNCTKYYPPKPCASVIKPEKWEGVADLIVQDQKALLEDSIIMCSYGGVPIKITDHLQVNQPTQLQPVAAPVIDPIDEPTIYSLEWKSNKEAKGKNDTVDFPDEVIEKTEVGNKIWLEAQTMGFFPGEELSFEITEETEKITLLKTSATIDAQGKVKILIGSFKNKEDELVGNPNPYKLKAIAKYDNIEKKADLQIDPPYYEIIDQQKGTNIVRVNEEGTTLMQIKHEFLNVGESIAQVKYNTSATITNRGTVVVSQFKQEISSRGEEVWYYKNSLGTFEGSLAEAKQVFPDVEFDDLKTPPPIDRSNPEFANLEIPPNQPLKWETINEFDAEQNGGKPTDWESWADATQTALDVIGMIPAVGIFADCLNGLISLSRGNYGDAALNFSAMVPILGTAVTVGKLAKKVKKATDKIEGVYDLVVKNTDKIKGYIGQSKDLTKRIEKHFGKRGKLKETIKQGQEIIYKMPGSTKVEREMYEQFAILKKYGENWKDAKKMINKVNPMGGRFDLKTEKGLQEFFKEAEKVANKYKLPKEFPRIDF